jgi:large subunit ribosomal protein L4
MPTVELKNLKNEVVGQVELSDEVFAAPHNPALIYDAVRWFMAKHRAGTAATKTRGEVSGAGRKLWRQKGTGRARIASLRSPIWRHGGTVHGPQPRDYAYTLPKKMVRGALRSALSERLREGNLQILDAFNLPTHKTKELAQALQGLGLTQKTLIVDSHANHQLGLASGNLPLVKLVDSKELNIYDTLDYQRIVFSQAAIQEIEQRLAK